MVAHTKEVKSMEAITENKQNKTIEMLKDVPTKQELADAAMSGFFAGIQSREAITTEKSA
jgi:hypothetical protein